MPEVRTDRTSGRKASTAVVLSLIMPGLGHVYCGRIVRGIILAFLSSIFIPVIFGALSVSSSSVRFGAIVAAMLASLTVLLVAVIDSWRTTRHTAEAYVLKDYNKWYVYVFLVLMSTGNSIQVAFQVRANLLQAFRVPTASNYPTIVPGDRLLANKLAYKNRDPQRGDLVVFINPQDRRINYIKRVVAVAGDTVEIKEGRVYVNDQELIRHNALQSILDNIRIEIRGKPLAGEVFYEINGGSKYKIFSAKPPHDRTSSDFAKITVPKHHCFVLGDNRNLSQDSRHFGPVPLATITGRADYLYFPAKDFSRFGRISSRQ